MSHEPTNALITGASRGIGRAVARAFADRGARLAIHYSQSAQAAQDLLSCLAGNGHCMVQADLGDEEQVANLFNQCIDNLGSIDVLVNNAGVFELHPIMDEDFDSWKRAWTRTLGVNLLGPAHLSFLVARDMTRRNGGKIINISSRGAFRGEPTAPAYGASKAGMNAMGQSLAVALAPYGVSVFTVAPGWVETDMAAPHLHGEDGESVRRQSPLNRAARPEEIAATVAFLAFEDTQYLTGCIIDVNGASYLRT